MKAGTIYLITILVLVVINFFIAYSYNSYINSSKCIVVNLESRYRKDSLEISNLRQLFYLQYRSYNRSLESAIEKQYSDLAGNKHIVVFIREDYCLPCVEGVLMDLELLRQSTKFEDFILLTDFEIEKEELAELKYYLQCELESITIYPDSSIFPEYSTSIVFLLDEELKMKHVFIPELFPHIRQDYFFTMLSSEIQD